MQKNSRMLKLHIIKSNGKIIIPAEEFKQLVEYAEMNDKVSIMDDEYQYLLDASSENLEFWDNEIDDKIWNNA